MNIAFAFIFILEMIIRQIGLGIKAYFRDPFNCFDTIVVLSSIFDLFFTTLLNSEKGGAITAMRAFRLIRIFKLAKSWKKF